jgi:hypothetical protein
MLAMKRTLIAWSVTAAAFIACVQCAYAARVYNETAVTINVSGGSGSGVNLEPGKRSDSIDWKTTQRIWVSWVNPSPQKEMCAVGRHFGSDLVGGNYLVVSQAVRNVTCTLCDSNHQVLSRSSGTLPDRAPAKQSNRQGC